jgi:hypothetical protein
MTKISIIFLVSLFTITCNSKKNSDKSSNPEIQINMADFDAQADIRKGDIHLISYGFTIPFPGQDSLTKKYGFYYQNRGCLVSDTTNKLAESYNDQVIEYLSKRNGKNWYKKFCLITDSLDNEMFRLLSDTIK